MAFFISDIISITEVLKLSTTQQSTDSVLANLLADVVLWDTTHGTTKEATIKTLVADCQALDTEILSAETTSGVQSMTFQREGTLTYKSGVDATSPLHQRKTKKIQQIFGLIDPHYGTAYDSLSAYLRSSVVINTL